MPSQTISGLAGEIRQSEVISNLVQYTFDPTNGEAISVEHPFSIILSQDCDLLRDYEDRYNQNESTLNGVLLFELDPVEIVRPRLAGGDILRRIRRHSDERYHLIDSAPENLDLHSQGIPELIVDFRRFFTMPAGEIYRQCKLQGDIGAKRRYRLDAPYREHLQNRMAFYLQRVALPE